MNITVDTSDITKNIDKLVKEGISNALKDGMEKALEIITNDAKNSCPVDTGKLQASIKNSIAIDDKEVKGIVYSDIEYAPFVHQSTGISDDKNAEPFITNAVQKNITNIMVQFKDKIGG